MSAVFTITVEPGKTSVHTQGQPGCVPVEALDAAIEALRHERRNVHNCPMQRACDSGRPPEEKVDG